MAKTSVDLRKIYKYFKEAESLRRSGIGAPDQRKKMAEDVIANTARQNAVAACAFFIPGADMPILTLNQMKMVIELAAVYDKKISVERAKELLLTIGSGYVLRSIARQLLGVIPGPGLIVKAVIAYTGTQAIGKLAQQYFEGQLRLPVKPRGGAKGGLPTARTR